MIKTFIAIIAKTNFFKYKFRLTKIIKVCIDFNGFTLTETKIQFIQFNNVMKFKLRDQVQLLLHRTAYIAISKMKNLRMPFKIKNNE